MDENHSGQEWKKKKKKEKIKMRELKNGVKEKNQGKTGLDLGDLGIYNFLLLSNFPSCHFLFRYSLRYIYIYIYIYLKSN